MCQRSENGSTRRISAARFARSADQREVEHLSIWSFIDTAGYGAATSVFISATRIRGGTSPAGDCCPCSQGEDRAVAQFFNLLYRRFAIGKLSEPPVTLRTGCGLETRDT